MTDPFWSSPTYRIAALIRSEGLLPKWIASMRQWAATGSGPDVEAARSWLPHWQDRPFYSSNELAPLFPAMMLSLGMIQQWQAPHGPARLRNELVRSKLPRLQNADGTLLFERDGKKREYFIVDDFQEWKNRPVTQREFEECIPSRT